MRRFAYFCFAFVVVLSLGSCVPIRAQELSSADWRAFRGRYKFHIQTIAISTPHADGSRTLIISEPPPHVTLEDLAHLDPVFSGAQVMTHPIGHDGWVKDVVAPLPAISDRDVQILGVRLSHYLFFTSYKTTVLPISPAGISARRSSLNLSISASQLKSWLARNEGSFSPLLGGDPRTWEEILGGAPGGVFLSSSPGLVLWAFQRADDLVGHRIEAREFALDSDLILGAVANDKSVVIIGRERVVPCELVPPLRVETILLLASVRGDELAQSYERTNFAAGKFDEKTKADWAPIYLSDELIDTEYGSLLNVTDQLLKSWSLNGTIRYENFNYPTPRNWPFPKPLIELLHTPELTFNWNTTGAGYATEGPRLTTVALESTGALPVSYIPEGHSSGRADDIDTKEDVAHTYFAIQSDPNLVRVVQYASLYQIFRRFEVHASIPHPVRPAVDDVLAKEVERELQAFVDLDDGQIDANLDHLKNSGQLTKLEILSVIESAEHLEDVQEMVKEVQKRWGEPGLKELAEQVASPRANATHSHGAIMRLQALLLQAPDSERKVMKAQLASPSKIIASLDDPVGILKQLSSAERKELALHIVAGELSEHSSLVRTFTGTSVVSLKDLYEAGAKRPDSGWIRTPSIVVSYTQSGLSSGGHNIDARVTEFRESADVPRGTVQVRTEGGKKLLLYNPADESYPHQLTGVVSKYGQYLPDDFLQQGLNETLGKAPKPPVLPRNVALGFNQTVRPSTDRGLQVNLERSGVPPSGFRTATEKLTPVQADFLRSLTGVKLKGTVVERRSPSSILIYNEGAGRVVEATDTVGAVDALGQIAEANRLQGHSPFILFRKGFSSDEANVMAGDVRRTTDVDVVVEVDESSAQEMRSLVKEDLLDLKEAKTSDPVAITDPKTGLSGVEVTAEIPFRSKLSSFFLKVRLYLQDTVRPFAEVAGNLRSAVEEIVGKLAGSLEDWSSLRVAAEANRELKKRFGSRVEVIAHQTKDALVVEKNTIHEPAA